MNSKVFSPEEFSKLLASDGLGDSMILTGVVKKSEHPDQILFSLQHNSHDWASIPLDKIEKVEWLGKVPCNDHVYDAINLYLKNECKKENGFYAELLQPFFSQSFVSQLTDSQKSSVLLGSYSDYNGSPTFDSATAVSLFHQCNNDHNNSCVVFGPIHLLYYVRYPTEDRS